jgi:hypothetical protein
MADERGQYEIEWHGDRAHIDPHDDSVDIYVTFEDGTSYTATFFTVKNITTLLDRYRETGECASGLYVYAVDMIIVHELSDEVVERTVADLLETAEFETAFARCEPGSSMSTIASSALKHLDALGLLDWQTLAEGYSRALLDTSEMARHAAKLVPPDGSHEDAAAIRASTDEDYFKRVKARLRSIADREARVAPSPAAERWLLASILAARQESPDAETLVRALADIHREFGDPPETAPAVYHVPPPGMSDLVPPELDRLIDWLTKRLTRERGENTGA